MHPLICSCHTMASWFILHVHSSGPIEEIIQWSLPKYGMHFLSGAATHLDCNLHDCSIRKRVVSPLYRQRTPRFRNVHSLTEGTYLLMAELGFEPVLLIKPVCSQSTCQMAWFGLKEHRNGAPSRSRTREHGLISHANNLLGEITLGKE